MDLCGNQKMAAKLKTLMDLKNTDSGHAGNQNFQKSKDWMCLDFGMEALDFQDMYHL